MIRQFNDRDYIYLGRGFPEYGIQHHLVIPIRAAYTRNMDRVFVLFDVFEECESKNGNKERIPSILATTMILSWTSYECLVNDLFNLLNDKLSLTKNASKFRYFGQREDLVADCVADYFVDKKSSYGHKRALKYLYLYRNTLAHNGGFVNKKFREKIREINNKSTNHLEQLNDGDLLPVDLSSATSLTDSVQQLSHSYLEASQKKLEALGIK